jgi:putative redox protein
MTTVTSTVSLKCSDSFLMTGVDSRGVPLVIGAWAEKEPVWRGLKASDLLLLAAASCSTYDVIMILNKQHEPLESIFVTCTGEQEIDPPNKFIKMHLHYTVKGNLHPDKVARAIQLSEEKYCSVTNTLRAGVEITSDFEVLN